MTLHRQVTHYSTLDTPIGRLIFGGGRSALTLIGLPRGSSAVIPNPDWRQDEILFPLAKRQVANYFAGSRDRFDFPMRLIGTDFQKRVWRTLLKIPIGATMSYSALAGLIGQPGAARAVGAANGRNPLPIVVPCHRLIGGNGSLTGFGGGLEVKRFLLKLESSEL